MNENQRYFAMGMNTIEFFASAEQAKLTAQAAIGQYREELDTEWPEDVEDVCWGEVRQFSSAVPIDGDDDSVDYELADIPLDTLSDQ